MNDDQELYRALGAIEAKLDQLIATDKQFRKEITQVSERVDSLEKHRSWAVGLATAITLLGATVAAVVSWAFTKAGVAL